MIPTRGPVNAALLKMTNAKKEGELYALRPLKEANATQDITIRDLRKSLLELKTRLSKYVVSRDDNESARAKYRRHCGRHHRRQRRCRRHHHDRHPPPPTATHHHPGTKTSTSSCPASARAPHSRSHPSRVGSSPLAAAAARELGATQRLARRSATATAAEAEAEAEAEASAPKPTQTTSPRVRTSSRPRRQAAMETVPSLAFANERVPTRPTGRFV